jgi:anti-sigma factor RsiW
MTNLCLEIEVIAAYIDGTIDRRTRRDVERHLASCEACYAVMADAARVMLETGSHEGATPPSGATSVHPLASRTAGEVTPRAALRPAAERMSRGWRSARIGIAFALAAGLTLVFGVTVRWVVDSPSSVGAGGRGELVAALGARRAFEPRLTGGFAHGPVVGRFRSAAASALPADVRLAIAQVEKRMSDDTTADGHALLGVAQLIGGEVDVAIVSLERATGLQPREPVHANDLAAAYLVRWHSTGSPSDAARARDLARRALRLAGGARPLLEAQFNLALACEQLRLRDEALDAWAAYLAVDSTSGWAREAREHVTRLSADR